MILLASASIRRTELLRLINVEHKVVSQNFDEDSVEEKDPILCSQKIVLGKNLSARSLLDEEDKIVPVLTSDTLVFCTR